MTDLDELDRKLYQAFAARRRSTAVGRPDLAAVERTFVRRRRRRTSIVVVAALVVIGAMGGAVALNQPGTDAASVSLTDGRSAEDGGSSAVPAPQTVSDDLPLWGFSPESGVPPTYFSGVAVEGPPVVAGARMVIQLQSSDTGARVAIVSADQPATEVASPGAQPIGDLAGHPALRMDRSISISETAVDLGSGRSLRLTSTGLDDADLAAVVAATSMQADGSLTFEALPAGLRPVEATRVDRSAYRRVILSYQGDRMLDRTMGIVEQYVVTTTNDPVVVAEGSVANAASSTPTMVDQRSSLVGMAPTMAAWRIGSVWYELAALHLGVAEEPSDLDPKVLDGLVPLTPADLASLVIAELEVDAWPTSQSTELSYPVDAAASDKMDRFIAALPADFKRFTTDPPTPLDHGIVVRAYSVSRGAWIDLTLVPSTTDGREPVREHVTQDEGRYRTLLWRAPSGWTYVLNTSSKTLDEAPLTLEEADALLRDLDG